MPSMREIYVLDNTLRDGGYVNDFRFGKRIIQEMICGLGEVGIDIIECGFLRSGQQDEERSVFSNMERIRECIGVKNKRSLYVAMLQYGKMCIDDIPLCDPENLDGIRVSFHAQEITPALVFARQLRDKGYKVFLQPVGMTSYTREELLKLMLEVNEIKPYAFYIVDTFGNMDGDKIIEIFRFIDCRLAQGILLGFHSHDNLQLSFFNAKALCCTESCRDLILDASMYGMGRGSGNLKTESILSYLNLNCHEKYDSSALNVLLEKYIVPLSKEYRWGYDPAYRYSAINNCHPNYARYLLEVRRLKKEDICDILCHMDVGKRTIYDESYIVQVCECRLNRKTASS